MPGGGATSRRRSEPSSAPLGVTSRRLLEPSINCSVYVHTQVDQWLDTATQLVSGLSFELLCGRLNDYLSMRSFFVGFTTTAADFAIWGQLHGT